MTPEKIFVSLDMAKKLKEAGWPQEEAFWWWAHIEGNEWDVFPDGYPYVKAFTRLAAPTATEILAYILEHDSGIVTWGYLFALLEEYLVNESNNLANASAALFCTRAELKFL